MGKCAKCNKTVGKKNPGVQCSKCSKWFHGSCVSLSTEQLSALAKTDCLDWKCSRCSTTSGGGKPKRISVILPDPEEDESDTEVDGPHTKIQEQEKILQDIRKDVKNMRETVRDIIRDEFQNTLHFYSSKIDDYEDKLQDYESRVKVMENQNKNLSNTCKNLELQIAVLEQKLNKMEQLQTSNVIEICGIMEKENEDVKKVVAQVGQLLKQNPNDVSKVHRKKPIARPGSAQAARAAADAPIVVTLREGSRDSWLHAARTTSISLRDLGHEKDSRIYVRAALSPTISYLLWKAKVDLRDKSLCKYVWCKDGVVMIRKSEGDKKVYYVRATGDIEVIKKELMKH